MYPDVFKERKAIPAPSAVTEHWVEVPALPSAKVELYRTMRERRIGRAALAQARGRQDRARRMSINGQSCYVVLGDGSRFLYTPAEG